MSTKIHSKKATSKSDSAANFPKDAAEWPMCVVRRSGAPPLRFKGREISRRNLNPQVVDGCVTLWQRKTGGYVAAMTLGGRRDAISSESLDKAMDWLEGHCGLSAPASKHALTVSMSDRLHDLIEQRQLRLLVGGALDDWDRLAIDSDDHSRQEKVTP